MKVLIVGQNPSKANTNPLIPFIGTKSNITLEKWMSLLEVKPNNRSLINAYSLVDFKVNSVSTFMMANTVREYYDIYKPGKVIALGNIASKVLTVAKVDHFKLPHPSPKNRKLNDKKWLNNELKKAREYLWQK